MSEYGGIRLVAFDMGGVMIDVDESIPIAQFAEMSGRSTEDAFNAIFSREKKRPVETGAISCSEHARRAVELLGLGIDEREFWRIHCTSHRAIPATGEIVSAVSEQTRVTIASNLPPAHWEWLQANLSYTHLFHKPVLSFEIGVMKPDPAYYEELLRLGQVQPHEVFFTDDMPENVAAAAALGIHAFLFTGPDRLREDLQTFGFRV